MLEDQIRALVSSLYARRHEAALALYEVRTLSDGAPREHECHVNVARFVRDNPDHRCVRGWFVIDLNESSRGLYPECNFIAHSLVETPDGQLIDITPCQLTDREPFLRHDGPEDQFVALVHAGYIRLSAADAGVLFDSGALSDA